MTSTVLEVEAVPPSPPMLTASVWLVGPSESGLEIHGRRVAAGAAAAAHALREDAVRLVADGFDVGVAVDLHRARDAARAAAAAHAHLDLVSTPWPPAGARCRRPTPPPPPTLCAKMPCASWPCVEIAPVREHVDVAGDAAAAAFDADFERGGLVAALLLAASCVTSMEFELLSPPPLPTLCAKMPIGAVALR